MVKKKLVLWIGSAFVISLIYLVVAAKPISSEFSLQTKWLVNLNDTNSQNTLDDSPSAEPIPFVLKDRYGYISPEGELLVKKTLQRHQFVAITPTRFTVFDPIPEIVTIDSITNKEIITIKNPRGYPFLIDEHVFLIGKDQDSLSAVSNTGVAQWTYHVSSPITTLDCRADKILIGTLDGTIYLLSLRGENLFTFQPGGSRLSVIVGAVLSSDANRIALISGIERQRFIILEKATKTYKVQHHQFLDSDFRRPVVVKFLQNDRYVLFEGKTNLMVFDSHKKKTYEIPVYFPILAIEALPNKDTVFVMTGKDNEKQLIALKMPDKKLLTAPFVSKESFIFSWEDQLILGSDDVITSYVVGE